MTSIIMEANHSSWSPETEWAELLQFARYEIGATDVNSRFAANGTHTATRVYEAYSPDEAEALLHIGNALILEKLDHRLNVSPSTRASIAKDGGTALFRTWDRDPQSTDKLAAQHLDALTTAAWNTSDDLRIAVWDAMDTLQPPARLTCNALSLAITHHRAESARPMPDDKPHYWELEHHGVDLIQGFNAEPRLTAGFFLNAVLATQRAIETANDSRAQKNEPPITQIDTEVLRRLPLVSAHYLMPSAVHLMRDSVETANSLIKNELARRN